jgi:hypothetical protein
MKTWLKVSLLLFFFALCVVAAIATHLARLRTPAPQAKALYAVVNEQLSAFRAEDFDSAYQNAAAGVQEKFSRGQFEQMIRHDFSSMTQTTHVEFGALRVAGDAALMEVFLTGRDQVVREYLYSFSAEQGAWKINGVQSTTAEPAAHVRGLRL